jgi:hypothetical protein
MLLITSSMKSKGYRNYDGPVDNVVDQLVINTGDDKTSNDVTDSDSDLSGINPLLDGY